MASQILKIEDIKSIVAQIAGEFGLIKVTLFGSYANGKRTRKSDIDLLVDFGPHPVSLFKVCGLKVELEERTGKEVDIIPMPLSKDTLLEIDKEVLLYAV